MISARHIRRSGRRATPGAAKGVSAQAALMVKQAWESLDSCENKLFGEMYATALERKVYYSEPFLFDFMKHLVHPPVSIEEFIDGPEYLGSSDITLWPEVRKAIIEINRNWWKGPKQANHEALLCGSCVDSETEFLTPAGWKYISEYADGDLVAQYHADGRAEFVHPLEYIKNPGSTFYHFAPRGGLDMMLTPGHRVIARNKNTRELQEWPAEEVARIHNKNVCGFTGRFLSTFNIEGQEGLPLSDAEIRVMVMVHADGSFYGDNRRCSVIVSKWRKIQRVHKLLAEAGIEYTEKPHGDGEFSRFCFYAPARSKTYSSWWGATTQQLRVVLDEVLHWDGTESLGHYYTSVRGDADFIQYAYAATGVRSTICSKSVRNPAHAPEYVVVRCKTAEFSMQASPHRRVRMVRASDGFAYCFSCPTKMWVARRNGRVFVTGNTSSGKSEIAKITTLYHLYLLSCLDVPQALYGLPKTTSIVFVILAAKPHVTKKVLYAPMRQLVETIPYFQKHLRPNKMVESEMIFEEKNIRIVPGGADAETVLGEAIIGGIIDEINFMHIVLKSKRAEVSTGRAGVYDQAQTIHNTVTRRKKGRFISQGPLLGVVCTSSSTRYNGDFTDKRKALVEKNNEKGVYIYDKPQYEVWPQERYCGEKFRMMVGNDVMGDTRILLPSEVAKEGTRVLNIPIEYLADFQSDPYSALRDICGISTSSINPFFRRRFKIYEGIDAGNEEGLASFLEKDNVILGVDDMPMVQAGHYCTNPSRPRYVHIDLSTTGDRCGIAMVRYDGMTEVTRSNNVIERLPVVSVELACSIEPDANNEIQFAEVRTWVKQLRDIYGYPIKAVTYDGVFSIESIQQWKKQGMKTGHMSVDRTSTPYKQFRDGLYDGRIRLFDQPILVQELFDLEYDENKDKVDHPVGCSKDVADAVCGAYSTLLLRRSSWRTEQIAEGELSDGRANYEERSEYGGRL